jgi:hypothetical protein
MKKLLLILSLLVVSAPAHATDAPPLSADEKTRIELAGQMHEIWPIRSRVESAMNVISANFPEEKQTEVKAAMRKAIKFEQLEEESIKAMAEVFTTDELKAMIAFYGSDTGKAISAKTQDYEMILRPIMTRMIDAAMLDLRTGMSE